VILVVDAKLSMPVLHGSDFVNQVEVVLAWCRWSCSISTWDVLGESNSSAAGASAMTHVVTFQQSRALAFQPECYC